MNRREEGFYWIKYEGGGGWELAEFTTGAWYLTGSDIGFHEDVDHSDGFGIRIVDSRRIYSPTGR